MSEQKAKSLEYYESAMRGATIARPTKDSAAVATPGAPVIVLCLRLLGVLSLAGGAIGAAFLTMRTLVPDALIFGTSAAVSGVLFFALASAIALLAQIRDRL